VASRIDNLALTLFPQGWNAIRHENRMLTLLFFSVGTFLVIVWAAMFGSPIYRWTFQNSPFFATMTITAFLILVATLALGFVCRLNFGKGLLEFLRMQETFDHFEFETVHPDAKRISVGSDIEKGEKRPSLDDLSSTMGNGAKRLSTAVARMSRQFFGGATGGASAASTRNDSDREAKEERKNVNPYTRAREMDKRQTSTSVVDIKKPPVSIATLSSPAAFKLSLKRTISSTSASTSISQAWSFADATTAPVPLVPAHLTSSQPSSRFSMDGSESNDIRTSEEQHRSTGSLPKLKTLQLPANRAAGLTISPDPFRREGMKSGWY